MPLGCANMDLGVGGPPFRGFKTPAPLKRHSRGTAGRALLRHPLLMAFRNTFSFLELRLVLPPVVGVSCEGSD